jgi:hypothetical protein
MIWDSIKRCFEPDRCTVPDCQNFQDGAFGLCEKHLVEQMQSWAEKDAHAKHRKLVNAMKDAIREVEKEHEREKPKT